MAMPIRGGILTCNIADTQTLYSSYLSFVTHGGIFVRSARKHNLGEDGLVAFTLPGSTERYTLSGKIVWINEKGTPSKPAGFGMQFGTDPNRLKLKNEIERLLAGEVEATRPTYTM